MDWNLTVEKNREALQRIVAVLVALAVLAVRAAGRSNPVRWLVLSVLRSAEAVAREFVAETVRAPQRSIEGAPELRTTPEDALFLAARFLALAAALEAFVPRARRRTACTDTAQCLPALLLRRLSITFGGWTPNPNDTS